MAEAQRAMAAVARQDYYPDVMVGAFCDARNDEEDTLGAMVNLSGRERDSRSCSPGPRHMDAAGRQPA
jgi:hypothetical protein